MPIASLNYQDRSRKNQTVILAALGVMHQKEVTTTIIALNIGG